MPDWLSISIGFVVISVIYYYTGKLVVKSVKFIWNKLFGKKKEK